MLKNRLHRFLLFLLLVLCNLLTVAHAAEKAGEPQSQLAANTVGADQLANVTLGLLVVLGLIFGLAWLFRRYGNLPNFNRSNIQILGGISLGPREKAVLLEVEGERLLVGVAAGQVTRLHAFPSVKQTVTAIDEQQAETDFAETLHQEQKINSGAAS